MDVEQYGFYSYSIAAVAYLLLFVLLIVKRNKNQTTFPFALASFLSLLWAGFSAYALKNDDIYLFDVLAAETLRNAGWYFFLSVLISRQQFQDQYGFFKRFWQPKAMLVLVVVVFVLELFSELRYNVQTIIGFDFRLIVHVIFALTGLILVEQLYRNAAVEQRWNIKFICISLAGLFIFDFIIFSKSLMFSTLDLDLWNARGLINALLVPLLIISIQRLHTESVPIAISKKLIFHTTVLIGAGLYLLLMSLMGVYIRDYGGNWGAIAQIGFIFLALVLLLVFFVSGKARALVKVYFSKHFFQHRYDYRHEWIKLSKTLAQLKSLDEVSGYIVTTMADLVESSGGGLWLKNSQGDYYLAEDKNLGFDAPQVITHDDLTIAYINKKQWVIDFVEYFENPETYEGADLEKWHAEENNIWLIVPLFLQNELKAFVVLSKPRVPRKIDWQDHDLLKTVGMQLANALVLTQASDELSRSRQFEAYNRLSAFLVHDLKNLIAQIALIVKNSEKHKHNPEFIDDSIETLENVVTKMERILRQLKKGDSYAEDWDTVDLVDVIKDVERQLCQNKPTLQIVFKTDKCLIQGDRNRLSSIFVHLIQNAQDATDDDGWVKLELDKTATQAIITISDNGCGMDQTFIQQRLFKPFDTTKGNAGMGIGVYEAREYVLQHSGQIQVESEPGKGTVFTLFFMLVDGQSKNYG